MNLRLDIQGLRAVAVVSVIIFHIQNKWLPGGFVGVDMFFVISGYLISKALIKQTDAHTFSYFDFIINRIKRIVPAYFVMCLVSAFIAIQLFIPNDLEAFLYNLIRGLIILEQKVLKIHYCILGH
jgi:peptidoglycan/LPS O-acetylase OafA/YrhL